jgi:hypothetical protein
MAMSKTIAELRNSFAKQTPGCLASGATTVEDDPEKIIGDLAAKLEKQGYEQEELDDLVHDLASQAAATVNNQGPEAQIRFLLEEMGSERDTLNALPLKESTNDAKPEPEQQGQG